jgi:hypothetical protein
MVASGKDKSVKRRLIIHCGVQKTGSTSLHHLVARNRAALSRDLEILTPAKGSLMRDLGHTAMQFSIDPSADLSARLIRLTRDLRDRLQTGSGTVLLSHENLPGAMIGKAGVGTLYPRLERIIGLLQTHLAPLEPEFVFYTRDMADWKSSVYNQAVRSDHYRHSRAEFLRATAACGTWESLKQRMLALAGPERVRFFRLEDETDEGLPGSQLLRHAGQSGTDLAALTPLGGPANQSLNSGALEFLRLVNGLGLERKARARIADLVSCNTSLFVSG